MSLVVIGLSYRTAPVEIRDGVAVLPQALDAVLQYFSSVPEIVECAVLSTCNRSEVYCVATDIHAARTAVIAGWSEQSGLDADALGQHTVVYRDAEAVRHLFGVACGLDSMVMGEPQIAGQVKEAGAAALSMGTSKTVLNRLFRTATEVSKRARTETEIATGAVSVSFAAVELAKKIFGNLEGHTALVLGAGEMSELTARHLTDNGVKSLLVTSRTLARAQNLAMRVGGRAISWDEGIGSLHGADVVISSTSAEAYVLERHHIAAAMQKRNNRSMFLIDIAMPRDIDPVVGDLYNVFLYDLDDLESVVGANLEKRKIEADKVNTIIEEEVENFSAWINSLSVVPAIVALRGHFQSFMDSELAQARLSEFSDEQRAQVTNLMRRFMNKVLHKPVTRLREAGEEEDGGAYVAALSYLFDLVVEDIEIEKVRNS
ncbi:MAG: glutamyl-tRNA reductase [Gemmatimonadetes bacterium]|nr:glutamyl-tRNA reductase [Gemmatimonadota bacterium]MYD60726.1 glutamyl-tRNA reductase [Gemmatimonadota bacterium]MYF75062.1 glutamyl-tRNA reductase [Gemmatimonadota bacterium]MYK52797.1 glutamyl-tRNA reductase [Gemmatimonadota bacterium]